MPRSLILSLLLVATALSASRIVVAEALLKPVPMPDTSKMPGAKAENLREIRVEFEKARQTSVGEELIAAYALLASAYAQYDLYEAAAVAMEDAAALAPKDGRWVYSQGVLARAQNQPAVAQSYFELAYTLDQNYLPVRMAVAGSKFSNGDAEGARRMLAEFVAAHTDEPAPYAMLGAIALKQKRYADAIEQTQHALRLAPNANSLYAQLADAEAGAGDARAASEARAKAGTVLPPLADPLGDGLLGKQTASAQAADDPAGKAVQEAVSLLAQHRYDDSRKRLDDALKAKPNDSVLLALYSRVEAAAGNVPAAKSRATAAVAADPKNALGPLSLGVALEMANDDSGAQRAYEQAIRLDDKLAKARLFLGNLLLRTGHNDDAITQYRAEVRLDFNDAESWSRLTAAYVLAGRCGSALTDVNDFLAANPANAFALQLFVRLASTCPAATAEQKRGALEIGARLYGKNPTAPVSEAFALAQAANGKWDDAIKTQEAGMFVAVRNGGKGNAGNLRDFLDLLKAHKLPDRPWPASAAVFHPQRLAADPKDAATAPPKR